ncbi:MAG: flavodoxin family protein [Candidatus Thorarchaeota archaeon]
MKTLVAYFTQTGNTKVIAEVIHEILSAHGEADISTVRKVDFDTLNEYDLIVVGAPCHDGDLALPVKGFLEKLPDSPSFKLAGFFTHATYTRDMGGRGEELYDKWAGLCSPTFENACKDKNIEFLGCFNCMGKASPPIEGFIKQEIITNEDEWNEYLPDLRQRPDSNDLEKARQFALELQEKL